MPNLIEDLIAESKVEQVSLDDRRIRLTITVRGNIHSYVLIPGEARIPLLPRAIYINALRVAEELNPPD